MEAIVSTPTMLRTHIADHDGAAPALVPVSVVCTPLQHTYGAQYGRSYTTAYSVRTAPPRGDVLLRNAIGSSTVLRTHRTCRARWQRWSTPYSLNVSACATGFALIP